MDQMMARLQEWAGRSQALEGRLAEAPSAALDEFCASLSMLQDPAAFSPQVAAAILAGLQIAQGAAQSGASTGGGRWAYKLERFSPAGTSLTLKRDPPDAVEAGFQLDNENRLCGMFYVQLGAPPQAKEFAFDLEQTPGGWNLRRWDDSQQTRFPLGTPGGLAFWNPSPKIDFWDDLVPDGGQALASWLTGPGAVSQPGDPLPKAQPALGTGSRPMAAAGSRPVAAALIQAKPEAALSIALVFVEGGKRIPVTGRLTIGRGQDNDLCLKDGEASRNHAVIEPIAGNWQIQDLDSTNGTWLNDSRITGTALLKVGDSLRIGKTRLRLEPADNPSSS